MKLSYDNIEILQTLFEGVTFVEEFDCSCVSNYPCDCSPIISEMKIGGKQFDIYQECIQTDPETGNWGGINFTKETTVADFEKLCAHLGVELKRIIHPTTLFD